jgi:hypothetical protein
MNEDTKLKLIVAGAGIAVAATAAGITHQIRKHRTCKPLPGTTKVEKIYVIKEKTNHKK